MQTAVARYGKVTTLFNGALDANLVTRHDRSVTELQEQVWDNTARRGAQGLLPLLQVRNPRTYPRWGWLGYQHLER